MNHSPTPSTPRARRAGRCAAAGLALTVCAPLGGCQIFGFLAVVGREAEKTRVRDVAPEYDGLKGKSFAVIVVADRIVQSDHPGVVEEITARVSDRLYGEAGATGWIPPNDVLAWQYSHPRWVVMPRGELARELGVDRLVVIELNEFRLNDPGNQYLWAGASEGVLGVIEADGAAADDYVFQREVAVRYPDKSGYGPADMSGPQVASVLLKRFIDRTSWLLYPHKETGQMDY